MFEFSKNKNPAPHGLTDILRARIRDSGPVDIGGFMDLALGHPAHGYYMTRDPLGARGDFTTAPEISQMFGEMLGAWAADVWHRLGAPDPFVLVECGPGRGTLLADALRATAKVPGFHAALRVHLVETSPVLHERQRVSLMDYSPVWHRDFGTIPADMPFILLANEFLDALPVRQIVRTGAGWAERVVTLDEDGNFTFGLAAPAPEDLPPLVRFAAREGDIAEISPAREGFVRSVCRALKTRRGAALLVDYGYDRPAAGESLQAVKDHAFAPILEDVGNADLTAHVDFGAILEVARAHGIAAAGPTGQGDFLTRLGIDARAEVLSRMASPEQAREIETARDRLVNPARMGGLFRVVALYEGVDRLPEGFV